MLVLSFGRFAGSATVQSAPPVEVTADGMALPAGTAAAEQARLRNDPAAISRSPAAVTADGMALPLPEPTSTDDVSFGTQQILKEQERPQNWIVTGDASIFFTDNVALTRAGAIDDFFAVVNAGAIWNKRLADDLDLQIGGRFSMFRYDKTSELDFYSLSAGAGVAWLASKQLGVILFGRYDFTELVTTDGSELLREHLFTAGLQRSLPLGRSHGVTLSLFGTAGIAEPHALQRQQIAATAGYQLLVTRNVLADIGYRVGYAFYEGERQDLTQVFSAGVAYRLTRWAALTALVSVGFNDSNRAAFDYEVLSVGGGIGFNVRF